MKHVYLILSLLFSTLFSLNQLRAQCGTGEALMSIVANPDECDLGTGLGFSVTLTFDGPPDPASSFALATGEIPTVTTSATANSLELTFNESNATCNVVIYDLSFTTALCADGVTPILISGASGLPGAGGNLDIAGSVGSVNLVPQQPTWRLSNPTNDICDPTTEMLSIDILDGMGNVCNTHMLAIPVTNTTCGIVTDFAVDISVADLETALGGINSAGCWNPIASMISLDPLGQTATIHPEQPTWVLSGPTDFCSGVSAMATLDIMIAGNNCAQLMVPVPDNMDCGNATDIMFDFLMSDVEAALAGAGFDLTGTVASGCWSDMFGEMITGVNVFPMQPTWDVTGVTEICSDGAAVATIEITSAGGTSCGTFDVMIMDNVLCPVQTTGFNFDLDWEAELATLGFTTTGLTAAGCYPNLVGEDVANNPSGTAINLYPVQPTWQITPGSTVDFCGDQSAQLSIDILVDGSPCGMHMHDVPLNDGCMVITDFAIDISAAEMETAMGITGADAAGCWVAISDMAASDPGGQTVNVYPQQPTWQLMGAQKVCSGENFVIEILAVDGTSCGMHNIVAPTNMTCALITSHPVAISEAEIATAMGITAPPAALGCWAAIAGNIDADPGGATAHVIPDQFTWDLAPGQDTEVCGDGTATVDIVIVDAAGTACPTPITINLTTPNNTCMGEQNVPITITLMDMETNLGLTGGDLTSTTGTACQADIVDNLNALTTPVTIHPNHDPAGLTWRLDPATAPHSYCGDGSEMVSIEILVGGTPCGVLQKAVDPNATCDLITMQTVTITAGELETLFGVTTPAAGSCYTDIMADLSMDPGGLAFNIFPEQLTAQFMMGSAEDVCSEDPSSISIELLNSGGTACAMPLLFDAPLNEGCGPLASVPITITLADIELALGWPTIPPACMADIMIDVAPEVDVWPAQPVMFTVTDLNMMPCSEDMDVIQVDLMSVDGSTVCASFLIDAPLVQTCDAATQLDFTILAADIKTEMMVPAAVCPTWFDIVDSHPINISTEDPTYNIVMDPSMEPNVCPGSMGAVIDILAADGTLCHTVELDVPDNDGCEPIEDFPLNFLYGRSDWINMTMGNDASCYAFVFDEDWLVNIYPQPFTLDTVGDMACMDLVAKLVSASGIDCYEQMKMCEGDTDMMDWDFTNMNSPWGTSPPWDLTSWPPACAPSILVADVFICSDCPSICGFAGAYDCWTNDCRDACILCDLSNLNISSCTPPAAFHDDANCNVEPPCANGSFSYENTSWFAFIAGSTNPIIIDIIVSTCATGSGIQAGIYDACPCAGGSCVTFYGQATTNANMVVPAPQIGDVYWMWVDGFAGAQCAFDIIIQQGDVFMWPPPEPLTIDGCEVDPVNFPNTYCLIDGTAKLYIEETQYLNLVGINDTWFQWNVTSSTGGTIPLVPSPQETPEPFICLEFTDPGTYEICLDGARNECDMTNPADAVCTTVTIVELPPVDFGVHQVCYNVIDPFGGDGFPIPAVGSGAGEQWQCGNLFVDYPDYDPSTGIATCQVTTGCGCTIDQFVEIEILGDDTPVDYDVFLCEANSTYINVQNGATGVYPVNTVGEIIYLEGQGSDGCDLPVALTVYHLDVELQIDTIAAGCAGLELCVSAESWTPPFFNPNDPNSMWIEWVDPGPDTILSTETCYAFTEEKPYELRVCYQQANQYAQTQFGQIDDPPCCKEFTIPVQFIPGEIIDPRLDDPLLTACPNEETTIVYNVVDQGDMYTFSVDPPSIVMNQLSPTSIAVTWDGTTEGQICVQSENNCDGVDLISNLVCRPFEYSPVQTYNITAIDSICVSDSLMVSWAGDNGAIASFVWDNGDIVDAGMYGWPTAGTQSYSMFVTDTFGCTFPAVSGVVEVLPQEFLSIDRDTAICLESGAFTIAADGPGRFVPSGNLSAISNNNTGGVSTASFNPPGPGLYTVDFLWNGFNSAGAQVKSGCPATPVSMNIEVVATPDVDFVIPDEICLGEMVPVSVTAADTVGNVNFAWSHPSGASSLTNDNTTFDLAYTDPGMYTVCLFTDRFTSLNNQCLSQEYCHDVLVKDTLTFLPFTCIAQDVDFVTFEWDIPAGVTGFDVSATDPVNGTVNLTNDPNNTYTASGLAENDVVTIIVTAIDPNGCGNKSFTVECIALACEDPEPEFNQVGPYCLDENPQPENLLRIFNAASQYPVDIESFSGPGVTDNGSNATFDPVTAGAGSHVVSYNMTDQLGCKFLFTRTIDVFAAPIDTLVGPDTICIDQIATIGYPLSLVNTNFSWDFGSGTGSNNGPVDESDPSAIDVEFNATGLQTITYSAERDGCDTDGQIEIFVIDTINTPLPQCGDAGLEFVEFNWGAITNVDMYQVSIDGSVLGMQDSLNLSVDILEGQSVEICVTALDPSGCGDKTRCLECRGLTCDDPYPITFSHPTDFCLSDQPDPFSIVPDLSVVPPNQVGTTGIEFEVDTLTGGGLIDPSGVFDPQRVGAGTYVVRYTYVNSIGCIYNYTTSITIFDSPTADFNVPPKVCLGSEITIIHQPDLGNPTASWMITNAAGTVEYISPDLDANPGTTSYNVSWSTDGIKMITLITERNGCITMNTQEVLVVGPADIDLGAPIGPLCISSAGIPLTQTWSTDSGDGIGSWLDTSDGNIVGDGNGGFLFTPSSLDNGIYTLTFQVNEDGCITTEETTVEVLASPSIDAGFVVNNICVLGDAVIQANASAGNGEVITWNFEGNPTIMGDQTGAGPLTLMWDTPGTYNVSVSIENGQCTDMASDVITVDPEMEIPVIDCDPEIDAVTFTWGAVDCASEYQVFVDGANVPAYSGPLTSFTVPNLEPGTNVQIRLVALPDASGSGGFCQCPASQALFDCTSLECPDYTLTFAQDTVGFCFGELQTVNLDPLVNGQSPTTGDTGWEGPGVGGTGIFDPFGIQPGEYDLIYTYDEFGTGFCEIKDTVKLLISDIPSVDLTPSDPVCINDNFGSIVPTPDGLGPFTIMINGPGAVDQVIPADEETIGLEPGIYDVLITDVNGCSAPSSTFEIIPAVQDFVDLSGETQLIAGQDESTYVFDTTIPGGVEIDSIVWTQRDTATGIVQTYDRINDISYDLEPVSDQTVEICVTLHYNGGCSIEDCILVDIRVIKVKYIPNIFTPFDGSTTNKTFRFYSNDRNAEVLEFAVYDRWGNLVFVRDGLPEVMGDANVAQGVQGESGGIFLWDGTVSVKDAPDGLSGERTQPGVYVYKILYSLDGQEQPIEAGDVTVLE